MIYFSLQREFCKILWLSYLLFYHLLCSIPWCQGILPLQVFQVPLQLYWVPIMFNSKAFYLCRFPRRPSLYISNTSNYTTDLIDLVIILKAFNFCRLSQMPLYITNTTNYETNILPLQVSQEPLPKVSAPVARGLPSWKRIQV